METIELQTLFNNYHRKITKVDLRFKRYLYSQINWDARIISIKGAHGVGKKVKQPCYYNKSFEQIADVPDSFLAVDDTEVGYGNRIPL